ncbi:formylglycine-generating enzyme family protein [Joostella atrarenae]|uniref:Formylglycine-generating enzyme family protein n=1 Tax=Joostella atrarenae TaxID=679257 RepID=A0ABS9J335_9FLAO|nr:formylglycine-generating enzyme family protein [Joostella atrarenae]MCF8714828.1 formylglycine-generating enzyme family protein [Joostella atrarenae]
MTSVTRLLLIFIVAFCAIQILPAQEMVTVKRGTYIPLYGNDSIPKVVEEFQIDMSPVTYSDYQKFLLENPAWQKKNIKGLFADDAYLTRWGEEATYAKDMNPDSPVTYVSWFAAKKYCECQNKRLPTTDEWEYVSMANEDEIDARKLESYNAEILSWYETSNTELNVVKRNPQNYWGVYDLHGLVWEWTQDFNSVLISGESRRDVNSDANLFCGGAAVGATDLMNYAAFMRYAFRGSIKARYSMKNLGFRCAKDATTLP